ncbi:DUF255 domain-containing protein, partial [Klebsiella variicola]
MPYPPGYREQAGTVILPQKNLLAEEASPYLRQHAQNPVHWRAWSQAALD